MAHGFEDRDSQQQAVKDGGDPLAELARLIGQADPFANFGRANPSHPTRRTQPVDPVQRSTPSREEHDDRDAQIRAPSGPSWMQHRALLAETPAEAEEADINATPHPLHRYAARHESAEDHADELPADIAPPFAAEADLHQPAEDHYDEALYSAQHQQFEQPHVGNADYVEGGYGYPAQDQETGADERRPRRGGMITVAAVVALAVVGTGGAFAYRNYAASPRNSEPPVIKADTTPTKAAPPTALGDAGSKLIQDRRAAGNSAEKLVSREETPVDVRDPSKAGPRVTFPPLNANGAPPSVASVPLNAKAMTGPTAAPGDEPRKVRTFVVKGDQSDVAGTPIARPAPRAPATVAAKSGATLAANASANGPMSLSPQAATADSRNRAASTNPAQTGSVAAGGYVVQVASQRSEADAQASFKALQGKYPAVLGSRSALIKRADLGGKGTFYRAMVGPFSNSSEAGAVCGSLKTAGGQCVVQRN